MTPGRGRCLVRKVETAESYTGAKIILPDVVREKLAAHQVEILAVGAPEICEFPNECERNLTHIGMASPDWSMERIWNRVTGDGDPDVQDIPCDWYHPFDGEPGDWALVAPRSLVETDTLDRFLVRQDDFLAILVP